MKNISLPIVDATMEEKRPNTQEKGKEIASAPDCIPVTCSKFQPVGSCHSHTQNSHNGKPKEEM